MDNATKAVIRERLLAVKARCAEAPEGSKKRIAEGEGAAAKKQDAFALALGYAKAEGYLLSQLAIAELEINTALRLLGEDVPAEVA